MSLLDVLLLSVIEGITEFLPISSTGHLILASHLLAIPQTEFLKTFEIVIQLGAILAVAILSFRNIAPSMNDWKKVLLAFIPTSIVGFILYRFIKDHLLGNDLIVVLSLLIGGVLLIVIELLLAKRQKPITSISHISNRSAVLIGLFQSLSVIPGVSRAAATIVGAMSLGVRRDTAVAFSFLLAIPTMAAASGYDILQTKLDFTQQELVFLMIGFVASFAVAYITVIYFLRFIKTHSFIPFGMYRIFIAVIYYLLMIR